MMTKRRRQMQDDGATEVTGAGRDRRAQNAAENLWRAVRSAPRSLLYPVMGMLLALATTTALLFALGLPDTGAGKTFFLVVAYSAVAVFALLGYLIGGSFDEARRLSITDPLTGLYNRRHFGQRLSEEAKRARRYGHSSSVLCVDVDRLKVINDDFGHKAGDGALVAVCRALLDNVRTADVVARIGGDEFAVLLPETSAAQASVLSQRVLAEVAWQADVLASGLAISIGIAQLNTATDVEPGDLLVAADDALYQAKAAGGGGRHVAVVPPDRGSPPVWRALDHATGGSAG
jgi:diguanylate cyclase (GGDEF)-like protein